MLMGQNLSDCSGNRKSNKNCHRNSEHFGKKFKIDPTTNCLKYEDFLEDSDWYINKSLKRKINKRLKKENKRKRYLKRARNK